MTLAHDSGTPAVVFRDVYKHFGGTVALKNVSFKIDRGELFGLVGQNGAGKTTLIKCLLDFCAADSGQIAIAGLSSRVTASRRDLAFLPERFTPPHYLTGRDFLRYMAELHRTTYDEDKVVGVLGRLDLDVSALVRPARVYSKGMTQKLGLAACFLSGKTLQILDEPTSGLDPKARALFKRELFGLRASGGTVFFTSHTLADVEELCDRMAVLHAGSLRFAGTPAQLVAQYGALDLEHAFLACVDDAVPA